MDGRLTFGESSRLQFDLRWDASSGGTPADATRGKLIVRLAGRAVWGRTLDEPEGFPWTWIELVEHLARHWGYILIEEGDPLGIDVPPERLRAKAEERWSGTTAEQREAEEELLFAYMESHDLASAVHGAYPSALWLTREGNSLRASCKQVVVRVPVDEARRILADVGDAIVARLASTADEPRAAAAVAAWRKREEIGSARLVEIATGLDHDAVTSFTKVTAFPVANLAFEAAFRPDEYLAVARMIGGALPTEEIEILFDAMRAQPAVSTKEADDLARDAGQFLDDLGEKPPFDQGREVARWLRSRLSMQDETRADPDQVLAKWHIPIARVALSSRDLDAISIWGPKHGPAVVVNRNGRHGRMNPLRATLAHEVGHVILDRLDALPVAEVMGGRVSRRVEMRARAFAAEFLLPEAVAGRAIVDAQTLMELKATVGRLSDWYGVSLEIVAWQAAKAHGRHLPLMVRTYLKSLVSNPESF